MKKVSKNAAKEFKDELCVCYSDDRNNALITTKTDAIKHANDMNEYVCSTPGYYPDLSRALGIGHITFSDAYYDFLDQFQRLRRLQSKCKIGKGLGPLGRQAKGNGLAYILANTKSINDFIIMTDKDLESVQHDSKVSLGLQDWIGVIESLETRRNKI
jgi:hypothetical protein